MPATFPVSSPLTPKYLQKIYISLLQMIKWRLWEGEWFVPSKYRKLIYLESESRFYLLYLTALRLVLSKYGWLWECLGITFSKQRCPFSSIQTSYPRWKPSICIFSKHFPGDSDQPLWWLVSLKIIVSDLLGDKKNGGGIQTCLKPCC